MDAFLAWATWEMCMAALNCGLLFGPHSTEEQCYKRNIIYTGSQRIQAPFIVPPGRLIHNLVPRVSLSPPLRGGERETLGTRLLDTS